MRQTDAVPILGAHVEAIGGLHLAFPRAAAMGAEAIQVHPHPAPLLGIAQPRRGAGRALPDGVGGGRFEELRAMLDGLHDPWVGVCLDTCHAFASGYEVRTAEGVQRTLDEWERVVGIDRLVAIRCNDSQSGLDSNRDRHANIGQGEIGEEGFRALLHELRLQRLPFIPEVPGLEGKGPDRANLEILRRLAA
jgi:apurinic endonuclease APN1